ncbi:MAG: hypothetical protein PHS53_02895 [Candidatus Pacebacteria bacterium]|nr:hypothetical protein [Candidatus Paceibacterota bacterium]MDD5357072.1 hypothetical protein [Candidatus Paceibacterota bacterium]
MKSYKLISVGLLAIAIFAFAHTVSATTILPRVFITSSTAGTDPVAISVSGFLTASADISTYRVRIVLHTSESDVIINPNFLPLSSGANDFRFLSTTPDKYIVGCVATAILEHSSGDSYVTDYSSNSAPCSGKLHVVTHVINDNSGTLTAPSFQTRSKDSVTSGNAAGKEDPGQLFQIHPGSYTIDVVDTHDYTKSFSEDCTGTFIKDETKTCTITLNDPAPASTPTPEVTPSPTPSVTPEPTPSPTPEVTPTPTPEVTPSPTPEITPTPTPSPTPEATPTPSPTPARHTSGGGSSGGSGKVLGAHTFSILDFNLLIVNWGKKGTNNSADFNSDGVVDILDFNQLLINWAK